MSKPVVTIARAVGVLAVLVAIAAAAIGGLLVIGSGGSSGFGAAIAIGLGIVLLGAAAVLIVPGLLLYRAARVVSDPESELEAPTGRSQLISNAAVLIVGLAWLSAIAVDALDHGLEPAVLALNAGGAVLCLTAALTARYLPGRPLGTSLLVIALLGAGVATWEVSATVDAMNRAAAFAAEQQRYQERFEPILSGPSTGDVREAVGRVGTWMPVTGAINPFGTYDEWPDMPKDALAELNGERARFAIVGQCWVEGGGGRLVTELWLVVGRDAQGEPTRSQMTLPAIPCDGDVRGVAGEGRLLPDFFRMSSPVEERRAWLLAIASVSDALRLDWDSHAERWLVFVSSEPASDLNAVRDAVAAVLGPLTLN